jgi:hypothetical protein
MDNRGGAPAADMEKRASDVEELEQDAVALEDASSSDGESEVRGSTDRPSVGLSPASWVRTRSIIVLALLQSRFCIISKAA